MIDLTDLDHIKPHTPQYPKPIPLLSEDNNASPTAFPKDALLDLEPVITALHESVQSPYLLCVHAVLSAVCLAIQPYALVELPHVGPRPLSCYFITIAKSGERKSATFAPALKPLKEKEKQLIEVYKEEKPQRKAKIDAYEVAKQRVRNDKSLSDHERIDKLAKIEALMPEEELTPLLIISDPNYPSLYRQLRYGHPSMGLMTDEGGQFTGGHGMNKDNITESLAGYNKLWDGSELTRLRVIEGASAIYERRLCMHVMMQPDLARHFLSNPELDDIGFTARSFITAPESTQGTRFVSEHNQDINTHPAMQIYHNQMEWILSEPLPLRDDSKELTPRILTLTIPAQESLRAFCNEVERDLTPYGQFSDISGFAAKAPEHALRLAGIIAMYENHHCTELDTRYLEAGIKLTRYYLYETLKHKSISAETCQYEKAQSLMNWIHKKDFTQVTARELYQNVIPKKLRRASIVKPLIRILEQHHHLIPIDNPDNPGSSQTEIWMINKTPPNS